MKSTKSKNTMVVLHSRDQWRVWNAQLRQLAESYGVFVYFDPFWPEKPDPSQPSELNIRHVKTTARSFVDLTADEKDSTYKFPVSEYHWDYDQQSIGAVRRTMMDPVLGDLNGDNTARPPTQPAPQPLRH